jgi:hypothetical protein
MQNPLRTEKTGVWVKTTPGLERERYTSPASAEIQTTIHPADLLLYRCAILGNNLTLNTETAQDITHCIFRPAKVASLME